MHTWGGPHLLEHTRIHPAMPRAHPRKSAHTRTCPHLHIPTHASMCTPHTCVYPCMPSDALAPSCTTIHTWTHKLPKNSKRGEKKWLGKSPQQTKAVSRVASICDKLLRRLIKFYFQNFFTYYSTTKEAYQFLRSVWIVI